MPRVLRYLLLFFWPTGIIGSSMILFYVFLLFGSFFLSFFSLALLFFDFSRLTSNFRLWGPGVCEIFAIFEKSLALVISSKLDLDWTADSPESCTRRCVRQDEATCLISESGERGALWQQRRQGGFLLRERRYQIFENPVQIRQIF